MGEPGPGPMAGPGMMGPGPGMIGPGPQGMMGPGPQGMMGPMDAGRRGAVCCSLTFDLAFEVCTCLGASMMGVTAAIGSAVWDVCGTCVTCAMGPARGMIGFVPGMMGPGPQGMMGPTDAGVCVGGYLSPQCDI